MNNARKNVLRALLIAAVLAGAGLGVLAQGVPGHPANCLILTCFDPSATGQMWRTLDPVGARTTPSHLGTQLFDEEEPTEPLLNPVGDPIFVSQSTVAPSEPDYNWEFAQLAPGECTFSHLGDDLDLPRQCKAPGGSAVPPPDTINVDGVPQPAFFYPAGIAVDGTTVWVADRMNHRVKAITFQGATVPVAHPIGNGIPGDGTYDYGAFDYSTDPPTALETPVVAQSGAQLSAPNGLAVDAAHHLLVADGGNGRIAIFNADGTPTFAEHFAMPENPLAPEETVVPTTVAISPGAVVGAPGTTPGNPLDRIVVLDRFTCGVWIMDTAFNPVATLPEDLPEHVGNGACWNDAWGFPSPLGTFSIVTGAAIDAAGHIYIVDSWNNRIAIYDRDGGLLGSFGEPPVLAPGEAPPIESLLTPSSVLVDHLGRLVVNDSDNARLAFYALDFGDGTTPPVATFQFEEPAAGDDVEEFPTGLAEQVGDGPGLDPAGRYLKIDTAAHRVQRLELSDLAIINAQAANGVGSFDVAVPMEKNRAIEFVTATAEAVESALHVANLQTADPAGADGTNTIYPGQLVHYTFTYTNDDPVNVRSFTFLLNAHGDKDTPQDTQADEVSVIVRGPCVSCDAVGTAYEYPAPETGNPVVATTTSTPSGDWYGTSIFVRLEPAGSEEVTAIGWRVTGTAVVRYGSANHYSPIDPEGTPYVDLLFSSPDSTLTYWSVTADDTVGVEHEMRLRVDIDPPTLTFGDWPVPAGVDPQGAAWYSGNVSASYFVADDESGPAAPSGTFTVTGEGRNLSTVVTGYDLVGHPSDSTTNDIGVGGLQVNIDRTAPTWFSLPDDVVVVETAPGYAVLDPGAFQAKADDALSGVATVSNPPDLFQWPVGTTTWPFVATDYAGNSTQVDRTVTVKSAGAINYTGALEVTYGDPLPVAASVSPSSATGTVTFDIAGLTTQADLSGGTASGAIPLTLGIGQYNVVVSYSGDATTSPMSTTAVITVVKRPITVQANPASKVYGAADPVLTYEVVSGSLVGSDGFGGSLWRVSGAEVADCPCAINSLLTTSSNYELTYIGAMFTITPRAATIAAADASKTYGAANPAFTATVEGTLPGDTLNYTLTTSATVTSGVLGYPIVVNLGSNPNYAVTPTNGTLQVTAREVTVTADSQTKVYGQPDPALTYSVTAGSVVNGDAFTGAPARAAGESVSGGPYAITQGTLTLGPNYALTFVGSTLAVTPATVVVTITAQDQAMTYGDAVPPLTATVSGGVPGDTLAYSVTTSATPTSPVGTYPITVTAGSNPNYETVGTTGGTLTVTARPAAITANAKTKVYGAAMPALTATVTGAANGDVLNYTLSSAATAASGVGSYPITVNVGANPNYSVTATGASVTITQKAATVTAGSGSKIQGAPDPIPVVSSSSTGFLPADGVTLSVSRDPGETPGTYTTRATAVAPASVLANYAITSVTGVFTINPSNRPPVCSAAYATPGEIWPPNHKPVTITIKGVTDPDNDPITIKITAILQDEPVNSGGDGDTGPDAGGVGTSTAWVLAERSGEGNGRVYEIRFTATDAKGASCTGKVLVGVPHDQHRPAVDSGVRYDSTVVPPHHHDKDCDKKNDHDHNGRCDDRDREDREKGKKDDKYDKYDKYDGKKDDKSDKYDDKKDDKDRRDKDDDHDRGGRDRDDRGDRYDRDGRK